MTVELVVATPLPAPLQRLRQRLPALWPEGAGWCYRALDFRLHLVEGAGGVAIAADGHLDAAFWAVVRVIRDALEGEVWCQGRRLDLGGLPAPRRWLFLRTA